MTSDGSLLFLHRALLAANTASGAALTMTTNAQKCLHLSDKGRLNRERCYQATYHHCSHILLQCVQIHDNARRGTSRSLFDCCRFQVLCVVETEAESMAET